jgi:uroporphyrin-III C-methyltransferase
VICRAHLPQQRQAVCTLATVADTLVDADLVSPAVLVVGDVVQAAPLWQQLQPEGAVRAAAGFPGG